MDLMQRYPAIPYLEARARRRVPGFVWDFFQGGIGDEVGLARNRSALADVRLRPRYLCDARDPDLSVTLFGQRFDLPFGVSPVGLGGLIWPRAAEILAKSARRANMPFALSSYATASLETIAEIAPEHAWFQRYVTNRQDIEADLTERTKRAGYKTLLITVDIPIAPKRDRDLHNGLSLPPRFTPRTVAQMVACPAWAMSVAATGVPNFGTIDKYVPKDAETVGLAKFLGEINQGHITPERLKILRDSWPDTLVVKGIIDPADAETCRQIGIDGIIVSNHGGRQLDAAQSAPEVLGEIRRAEGRDMAIIADGGVRSGLDVVRMLAAGADFVMMGRAFMYGVAALGQQGGDHVVEILRREVRTTMAQIGCRRVADLPDFLVTSPR